MAQMDMEPHRSPFIRPVVFVVPLVRFRGSLRETAGPPMGLGNGRV